MLYMRRRHVGRVCGILKELIATYEKTKEEELIRAQLSKIQSEEAKLQHALKELEAKKKSLLLAGQEGRKRSTPMSPALSSASSAGSKKPKSNDAKDYSRIGQPILNDEDEEQQTALGCLLSKEMPLSFEEFTRLNNEDAARHVKASLYNEKTQINLKRLRSDGLELSAFKEALRAKCIKYGRITNLSKFSKRAAVKEIAAKKGLDARKLWKIYNTTWDLLTGISLIRVRVMKEKPGKKVVEEEGDDDIDDYDDDDDEILPPAEEDYDMVEEDEEDA